MRTLELKDLAQVLAGNNGLIIGPTVSLHAGISYDLKQHLSVDASTSAYWSIIATAAAKDPVTTEQRFLEILSQRQTNPVLSSLCEGSWNATISLSHDANFEHQYRLTTSSTKPHRYPVTVLDALNRPVPDRITPVFKMFGVAQPGKTTITDTQMLVRRAHWQPAVKALCDSIKDGSVFCLGLDEVEDLFKELLVLFIGSRTTQPKNFIFFKDDPLANSKSISDLVETFSRFVVVQANTTSLAAAITQSRNIDHTRSVLISDKSTQVLSIHYSRLVNIVNDHLKPQSAKTERHLLLDMLFSPHLVSWDPFAHNMDFPRTSAAIRLDITNELSNNSFRSTAIVISGSAASGKTVLLKRLAFDLASDDRLVLWLKPSTGTDNAQLMKEVFRKIRQIHRDEPIVVVMDDPTAFTALTPRDVVLAAKNAGLEFLLLVAVRTSEWQVRDTKHFVGPLAVSAQHALPDSFDEAEWSLLPDYLVKLEFYPDTSRARTAMSGLSKRASSDVLSTLYFLLSDTKPVISNSIKEEYFRLGDISGLSQVVLGRVKKTSDLLREAYELVAVSNYYRSLLPIEILVSSLDVRYDDWLQAQPPQGSAWGLLYPDDDPRLPGTAYSTRNDVVTRILIGIVNGGSISHTGEINALRRLLAACSGTSVLYREYCVKLLVNNDMLSHLEYPDVLALFDIAIGALPARDRTLLHHKAICMRAKGNDPAGALVVLEEALGTPHYPYAAQSEPDEHIHNSIAAAYSDLLDTGQIDLETATASIIEHLSLSRSADFHNYFAAHVHINSILKLLSKLPQDRVLDREALTVRAISDVENTLTSIKNNLQSDETVSSEDVSMLEASRTKLLTKTRTFAEVDSTALTHWVQFRSQDGYALAARIMFEEAKTTNKGHSYRDAFEYAKAAIDRVRADGSEPSVHLAEVAVQIYYTWRVTRRISTRNQKNEINWGLITELSVIAQHANRGGQDVHLKYLQALALCHLGKWPHADAIFHSLRQSRLPYSVLWLTRDFLLDEFGAVQRIQGEIRSIGDRTYLHAADLGTDFLCSRNHAWPRSGEIAHSFVQFHYAGPTAYPLSVLGVD